MERFAEVPGGRIHYTFTGMGPVVLLIQGVGLHGGGWKPQTEALAARHACLAFDHRGTGRSSAPTEPVTVRQMAEDARAVLDTEGISAVHLVGHSLGGLVALWMAIEDPGRVASLSLLCSFADGKGAAPLTSRMAWLGFRSRFGTVAQRRRAFLRLIVPPGPIDDEAAMAERMGDLFGHDLGIQPNVVTAQLRAMRRVDLSARLAELSGVPALVVSAAHDPIAPPALGQALAAGLPGAHYLEIPDASHGVTITHAPQINSVLLDHLEAAEHV